MSSLLRGQRAEASVPSQTALPPTEPPAAAPARQLIPRWYFFAADVLLVAVALIFIHQCAPGTKWVLRLFSMGLVLLGCALGLVGVWMGAQKSKG